MHQCLQKGIPKNKNSSRNHEKASYFLATILTQKLREFQVKAISIEIKKRRHNTLAFQNHLPNKAMGDAARVKGSGVT